MLFDVVALDCDDVWLPQGGNRLRQHHRNCCLAQLEWRSRVRIQC
jgi:hypothetical protein